MLNTLNSEQQGGHLSSTSKQSINSENEDDDNITATTTATTTSRNNNNSGGDGNYLNFICSSIMTCFRIFSRCDGNSISNFKHYLANSKNGVSCLIITYKICAIICFCFSILVLW